MTQREMINLRWSGSALAYSTGVKDECGTSVELGKISVLGAPA